MGNQMMPANQPMRNMGHQIVRIPYGQTLMVPSNATMLNSAQGQIYYQPTRPAQFGSYLIQPSNAVSTDSYSSQSVPLHSNINQIPSQPATVNSNAGQVIAPTTPLTESEVTKAPQAITKPLPAVTSNYQKPLSQIIKAENEPCQPDYDDTILNHFPKSENQQNVENS